MSKQHKQLEAYTKASLEVVNFKAKHGKIFDKYNELLAAAESAEKVLKDYIKSDVKDNIANEFVKCTYAPAFSKYYDSEVIMKNATPAEVKALKSEGALVEQVTIDKDKFEYAVEKGLVSTKLKQKAFREKENAPRVNIKEVK